jgi:hypothetical protein
MLGFNVLMLVVVPGTDVCVVVTAPVWPVRPESGNWVATAPCDEGPAARPNCPDAQQLIRKTAMHTQATGRTLRRIGIIFMGTKPFLS